MSELFEKVKIKAWYFSTEMREDGWFLGPFFPRIDTFYTCALLFEDRETLGLVTDHYIHWILTGEQLYDEDYEEVIPVGSLVTGPTGMWEKKEYGLDEKPPVEYAYEPTAVLSDGDKVSVEIKRNFKTPRHWQDRFWDFVLKYDFYIDVFFHFFIGLLLGFLIGFVGSKEIL